MDVTFTVDLCEFSNFSASAFTYCIYFSRQKYHNSQDNFCCPPGKPSHPPKKSFPVKNGLFAYLNIFILIWQHILTEVLPQTSIFPSWVKFENTHMQETRGTRSRWQQGAPAAVFLPHLLRFQPWKIPAGGEPRALGWSLSTNKRLH